MRYRVLAVSLMLVAAACGGSGATVATTGTPSTTSASTGPATTSAPGSTENPGTTTATTQALRAEGLVAPSFVTTLSDGSQFNMGEHDRPVYLVFWAEW